MPEWGGIRALSFSLQENGKFKGLSYIAKNPVKRIAACYLLPGFIIV